MRWLCQHKYYVYTYVHTQYMKCYPVLLHSRFLIQFGLMLWLLCGQKLKCHEIKECPCTKLFCLLLRQHIMLWKLQLFRAFLETITSYCYFDWENKKSFVLRLNIPPSIIKEWSWLLIDCNPPFPLEAGMWNSFYMRPILILCWDLYTDTRCLTKHLIPVISWYKIKIK